MFHSRLKEFYLRVLRPEMLSQYSFAARIDSLTISIPLETAETMGTEGRYKIAVFLEAISGQRPYLIPIHTSAAQTFRCEHPLSKMTEEARRKLGNASQTGDGTRSSLSILRTTLSRSNMWSFLEKLYDFYLPDVTADEESARVNFTGMSKLGLIRYFEKERKGLCAVGAPRFPLYINAKNSIMMNDIVASYALKTRDFLKFPEIEASFEHLSSLLSEGSSQNLTVYIRPTLSISPNVIKANEAIQFAAVSPLNVYNHLLSQLFNPYLQRIQVAKTQKQIDGEIEKQRQANIQALWVEKPSQQQQQQKQQQ